MLEIALFGRFDLRLDGKPIALASRLQKKLIAYLILNVGRSIPRVKLAGILWPDSSEEIARKNLRHHLWRLRQAIGEEYLLTTRNAVGFNDASNYSLDVELLEKGSVAGDTAQLIGAVSVYQGKLLPGFYDDWLQLESERLQAVFERRMQALLGKLAAEERWSELITWAEHWIAQGQTPEPAYRYLMVGCAGLEDVAGIATNYRRCEQALRKTLGVEPSDVTQSLFETLTSAKQLSAEETIFGPVVTARMPHFLQVENEPARPAFVDREDELARLTKILVASQEGQGRVAFVTGDAGSGKTSMMRAFAAQASEIYPDLLVASGTCNAFGGPGDPFLPFRKALSMLIGDLEEAWLAGVITTSQARLLWEKMPQTTKTLLDYSPNLLDTFIPATPLINRLRSAFPADRPVLKQLEDRTSPKSLAFGLELPQLLEEFATFFRHLTKRQPLILLLDDLQWADIGSIELLFHLSRGLSGARILLLGAYRPDEVETSRKHPLSPVLAEIRRSFGDVWLDLNRSAGRAFIEAYIDNESNHLGVDFREKLFQRTGGHALFTVELLRDMQDRGNLIKDEFNAWTVKATVDWDVLPAKVKGTVESRVGRLEQDLHDVLSMAAVEGEVFTAQAVARMLGLKERLVLRMLSGELSRRYRLVQKDRTEQVDGRMISRYRFAHQMFQQYLYKEVPEAERRSLHGQLGEILEALYVDMNDEMVVQLARHFVEAGIKDKAVTYLLAAADRAQALYALEEAARAYERALVFLREEGYLERTARTLMKLGLVYQNSFDFERSRKAYDEGLTLWREISATSEVFTPPAPRTLKLIRASELPTLDPNKAGDTASAAAIHQLFCSLVELTHSGELVPAGAASWDVMESGRRYVFQLRQDAHWSDGRPVTARDYEFSWKRILAPGFDSENYHLLLDIRNAREYHQGALPDPGEIGIRSLDEWTLQVDLEEPVGYFMQLMASVGFPVPRHVVERLGDAWSLPANLVGNGPFMINSWAPGAGYTFVRNPHYTGLSSGNVSQVHMSQVDAEEISSYYESDRCDFLNLDPLEPKKQARLLRRHPEEVHSRYGMRAGCLIVNTTLSPLNDVRVRQALALALDKKQAIRQLGLPRLTPALGGFVPPGIPGHLPDAGVPFAPGRARALLEEAGFGSDRRPPTLRIAFDPGFSEWPAVLGRQWSEHLNIRLDPLELPFSELHRLDHHHDYHLVCTGWTADYPDPDSFLRIFGIHYRSGWRNSEYETLVERARVIADQSQRLAMYRQAEEILAREVPIIPLSYGRHDYLVKPWVRNPPTSPLALFLWKDLVLEDEISKVLRSTP